MTTLNNLEGVTFDLCDELNDIYYANLKNLILFSIYTAIVNSNCYIYCNDLLLIFKDDVKNIFFLD